MNYLNLFIILTVGILIGAYINQNYDIPTLGNYIDKIKEFEKDHRKSQTNNVLHYQNK